MPAIVFFIRGQHPLGVRRGCKGLKPQQHTQGPLLPRMFDQGSTSTPAAPADISPITAAWAKPSCAKIANTCSTAAGEHDTSRPPDVCGSVSNAFCTGVIV